MSAPLDTEPAPAPDVAAFRPTVVALLSLPQDAAHFEEVVRAQGGALYVAPSAQAFVDTVDAAFPVLAIIDLSAGGEWFAAIQRCKLRPQTRHIVILVFAEEPSLELHRNALEAGADQVLTRAQLMADLPAIVAAHVAPQVRYVAGWQEPLGESARRGIEAFNRGAYWEQHEMLEAAWRAEVRPVREMYQGILQVGVALLHIERDNWAGGIKCFRRGLPRLRDLPPVCQGVHVAELRAAAEALHARITLLGPARLREVERSAFPQIVLDD